MSTSWVARSTVTPTSRIRAGNGPARRLDDRVDRRQPARLEQPAELEDRRVEPLDVADLDRHAARRAPRRRSGSASSSVAASGFSTRTGDAALDRGERERQVGRRRRGDDDRVELGLGDHRQRLGEPLGAGSPASPRRARPAPGRRRRRAGRRAATTRTRRWLRPIDPSPTRPTPQLAVPAGRPGVRSSRRLGLGASASAAMAARRPPGPRR